MYLRSSFRKPQLLLRDSHSGIVEAYEENTVDVLSPVRREICLVACSGKLRQVYLQR